MNLIQKFLSLFRPALPGIPRNYSGIIPDPRTGAEKSRDKVAGTANSLPSIARLSSPDWSPYLCAAEPQGKIWVWDTFACATFSAGENLEEQIIWLLVNGKVPQGIIDRMRELGFFRDPADVRTFKISKRFSAIMNGTTRQGNYFQKVADCYRNMGFIPDTMLPFGGNNWNEYMNPALVTNQMILVARETMSYFKIFYEFVNLNTADGISPVELENLKTLLLATPIQIAIPSPATHAQLLNAVEYQTFKILDTYEPFYITRLIDSPRIDYAMRYYVIALDALPVSLNRNLYQGMKGEDVAIVQRFLNIAADGSFGPKTKAAIINFQASYGLARDGIWGNKCREKMRELK